MENILRFESKCGATFRKTMIVIFWLLTLCGTVISGSVYFKLLKKVSGISVYDYDQKRFFIYLILLVMESRNWICISGYLFPKALTASLNGYNPRPSIGYGHDYPKAFAKIYKEVLGYTDYKNVTNEDLWRIREVWDQQVKSIEGRCQNG